MAAERGEIIEHPGHDDEELYTEERAARFLMVSTRSLQNWRTRNLGPLGPPFVRISARCIRYRRGDLVAYARARLRHHDRPTSPRPELVDEDPPQRAGPDAADGEPDGLPDPEAEETTCLHDQA